MVALGMLFIFIGLVSTIYYFWGRRLFRTRWVLWLLVASVFLTEVATIAGWWTAEFGRQPWVVYKLLTTASAVSPSLKTQQVVFSVITFVVMYAILLVLFIYLLNKDIQRGPQPPQEPEHVEALPDTFRAVFRSPRQVAR
jgi:cytochrome d ubiquinol oxidase subunit I